MFVHLGEVTDGVLKVGDSVEAIVDAGRVASQGGEATARDCVRELSQTLLQLKPRIFR